LCYVRVIVRAGDYWGVILYHVMQIIILDFESGTVHVHDIPKKMQELDGVEMVDKLGYRESNCQYMISDTKININYETRKN
jgi:hypothetical protein